MEVQSSAAMQMHFPGIVAIRCCTGCQAGKSLTIEFFYCHKSNRAGFDTRCRDCRNASRRIWRAANRDGINARRRELYALRKASKGESPDEKGSAEQSDAGDSHREESFGSGGLAETHVAPASLAPAHAADELIKSFGIFTAAPFMELPPVHFSPNPGMDHVATNTVIGKHGATSDAGHDARPVAKPDKPDAGRASTFELGDIPECLRRTRSAA
jgi:hypothetical protein